MSTVRATSFQNAGSANVNMTLDTNGNATFAGMTSPGYSFMRNKIINGDMRIDQRNAGASVTPTTDAGYSLDRWQQRLSQSSKFSVQQNAGSVTPPVGFTNYLGVTSLSAYSVLSSDFFGVEQNIEGYNVTDFGWGAAGGSAATLSFWVRSSLTGTFGASLFNQSGSVSIPLSYTISAANTWEFKTIAIPTSSISGTFSSNTNGLGISVFFSLGCGAGQSGGTAGAWQGSLTRQPSGSVSVVGTNAATWYITGVQLESGTVATPFERRQYGQEFSLCQRYYQAGLARLRGTQASGVLESTMLFPVTMRATPTMTGTDISALSSATLLISTTLNSTGNVSWTASAEL